MPSTQEKQPTPSAYREPQVNILCSVAGFAVPYPDSVNEKVKPSNTIFNWGGVKIAKISPEVVVKFGSHVTLSEAKSMIFVKQNTETISVPKGLFDTYIFMSFVEGQSLDKAWETYGSLTKHQVTHQLKGYLGELRQISHSNYIGSVDLGPVTNPILKSHRVKGPFDSEEAFNNAIIDAYQSKAPKSHIKNFLAGMLSHKRHQIVFTHGDLRLQNIMVKDGGVSGIVDWEFSGWYPEYWEFSKALYVWKWQNDWIEYLVQILDLITPSMRSIRS